MEEGKGPTAQLYYTLRSNEKTQVHARTFPVAASATARVNRNTTRPQQDVSLVGTCHHQDGCHRRTPPVGLQPKSPQSLQMHRGKWKKVSARGRVGCGNTGSGREGELFVNGPWTMPGAPQQFSIYHSPLYKGEVGRIG